MSLSFRRYILALSPALVLWSCTDSASVTEPDVPPDNYVAFAVPGDDQGATTTMSIRDFKVFAYTQAPWGIGQIIMPFTVVTRTNLNNWTYSPKIEWPEEPVDFNCVSPASIDMSNEYSVRTISYNKNSNTQAYTGGDVDLLIASRVNVDPRSGRLKFNFRHALTQLKIALRATDTGNTSVEVYKVYLQGRAEGKLFIPMEDTTPETNDGSLLNNWTIYSKSGPELPFFDPVDGGYLVLTDKATDTAPDGKFVIPMTLDDYYYEYYARGTYIEVVYRITDNDTGATVWPDASTPGDQVWLRDKTYASAKFGLKADTPEGTWYPGKRYMYTVRMDGQRLRNPRRETRNSAPVTDVEKHAGDQQGYAEAVIDTDVAQITSTGQGQQ